MWENTNQPKLFSPLAIAQMKKPSTAEDLHGNKKSKTKGTKKPLNKQQNQTQKSYAPRPEIK